MRIAVCYFGYLRVLSEVFANQYENLFKNYDVDFFCHTWSDNYHNEIQFLKDNIKPKRLLIEDLKFFEKNSFNSSNRSKQCFERNYEIKKYLDCQSKPYNVLHMLYSIQKANSLRKEYSQNHNISYDCSLLIRSDISFNSPINVETLDMNKINKTWVNRKDKSSEFNDHIAISSTKNIDIYSDCFLYSSAYYLSDNITFIPENILTWHAKEMNLKIDMIDSIHNIVRPSNFTGHWPEIKS